jgi:hypothetical protein
MRPETITINREEWKELIKIRIHMEQYFSYKNDSREVIAELAPKFLEDVEQILITNNN